MSNIKKLTSKVQSSTLSIFYALQTCLKHALLNSPALLQKRLGYQSESLDDDDLLNFDFIEKAITKRVELAFEYEGKAYQIKPFKLAYFGGFWYVLGFDKKDELFKKFYFKAMKNLQSLERSFALDERVEKRLKNAHSVWFNLEAFFSAASH